RPPEAELAILVAPHAEAAVVHEHMMERTEQRGVVEARLPAVRPMLEVVTIHKALAMAVRKNAPAVPRPQRSPQRRRQRAPLAPDVKRIAPLILVDRDDAAVATEPLDGFYRQIRPPCTSAEGRF